MTSRNLWFYFRYGLVDNPADRFVTIGFLVSSCFILNFVVNLFVWCGMLSRWSWTVDRYLEWSPVCNSLNQHLAVYDSGLVFCTGLVLNFLIKMFKGLKLGSLVV